MKDLILFRGLPGAGKSTLAELTCDVAYSADDYFTNTEGAYYYDKSQIKAAHEDCLCRTKAAMASGVERIGVANTFTEAWEMEPYFRLADNEGYRIHAVIVETRGEVVRSYSRPRTSVLQRGPQRPVVRHIRQGPKSEWRNRDMRMHHKQFVRPPPLVEGALTLSLPQR